MKRRVNFYFKPCDLRIGLHYDRTSKDLHVSLLPTLGLVIHTDQLCWWRPHAWSGWIENLNNGAISSRYRQCSRCLTVKVESES